MTPDQPTPYLRAADTDREAAVEKLRTAAVEGRLDHDELEQRLTAAYGAKWCSDLDRLTADVTPVPLPPPPPVPYAQQIAVPAAALLHQRHGRGVARGVAAVVLLDRIRAAIGFGHVALGQIKAAEGRETGTGMAIAGLVLGYLQIGGLLLALLFGAT